MKDFLNDIKKLKNIADLGLLYATDPFDRERYTELHELSLKLLAQLTDTPLSKINDFYAPITDYPTPKVDVRALVLNDKNQILLARERSDRRWSLPGGWADVGLSASEVAAKEVHEETGLTVSPTRLLAVFDKKCHPHPPQAFYVYKFVILCTIVSGELVPAHDILDARFFDIADLPPLSENRILASQIALVYQKAVGLDLEAYFD
jgi:ADP-ribose pyrophosphatase YjhB (NUDIX family)